MSTHHLPAQLRHDVPTSRAGRCAAALMMLAAVGLGATIAALIARPPQGEALTDDPWSTVPALLTVAAAVLGGVLGGVALWARHDRSPWVVSAVTVAGAVLVILVGELAFPH